MGLSQVLFIALRVLLILNTAATRAITHTNRSHYRYYNFGGDHISWNTVHIKLYIKDQTFI